MKTCSECGTLLKENAKFCPKCGVKVREEVGGETVRAQQPVQPGAPKKKSVVPFVLICLVLILAMGVGTAFYVWKLNGLDRSQEALADKDRDETQVEVPHEKPEQRESTMAAEAAMQATLPTQVPTTAAVPQTAAMPTEASTAPYVPANYTTLYVVNCSEFITLRSSASTSASELIKIPLGSAVSYVSTAENGFYKVVYNGKTGYALASYLSSDVYSYEAPDTTSYPTMYVVNCDEFITLRTSDSTSASEIMKIPLGSAVSYISTAGNGFYKIIYNGNTGYALASYLSY